MRGSTVWISGAALFLAACTSCSGAGSGSDGGSAASGGGGSSGGGISLARACADFARATCMQASTCTPFTQALAYGSEATCEQRAVLACMPIVGAAGSSITPAGIESCAQAIQGETCVEFLDNTQPSACNFAGTLAAGSACGTDSQCQSAYCRLTPGTTCGKCQDRAGAAQAGPGGGPACLGDTDCQANLLCAAGQCVSPAMAGGACSAQQPCIRTLACISGKCATPVPVGGACAAVTDCDGASGAVCDLTRKPGVCVAIATANAGQSCGLMGGMLTACTAASTCDNLANMVGTCHQPAADNAPCGPGVGCMLPALCTTSAKCTLSDPANCR